MIVLIAGASHTGKTLLAQNLLEKYNYPYLSIDLLKMGLIRSGNTHLTPEDDRELGKYLWPIVCGMIKPAVENQQDLIIEGIYIPFDWKEDFEKEYQQEMKYICLIMSEQYIQNHFNRIKKYANAAEVRIDDTDCTKDELQKDNAYNLEMCIKHDCNYILINDDYQVNFKL